MQDAESSVLVETGEIRYYKGKIRNFEVKVGRNWISLLGSLPQLLYPDNTHVLMLEEVKKSLDVLSNDLHIDVGELPLTRIDIAGTFPMDKPVGNYLDCLGHLSRWKRVLTTEDETLYYRQGNEKYGRDLCFYDKNKQWKEKKSLMPTEIRGENLLRYEARWKGKLHKRFNVPEVKGRHLYDEQFYQMLVQEWARLYFLIETNSVQAIDCQKDKMTPKEAIKLLLSLLLSREPVTTVDDYIKDLKKNKAFKNNQDCNRTRKSLKEIERLAGMMHEAETAQELDEKVKAVVDGLTHKLS